MNVSSAIALEKSFARTAAAELVDERFSDEFLKFQILKLFDDASAIGRRDLERHLPNVDPERGQSILATIQGAPHQSNPKPQ